LAILAKIGPAFENAISEYLHFQSVKETEAGGASYPEGNAELIGVSLKRNPDGLRSFLRGF
jgi:DNA polymerase/3'-5' exonuclease PolX